jgi:hypothetical protein
MFGLHLGMTLLHVLRGLAPERWQGNRKTNMGVMLTEEIYGKTYLEEKSSLLHLLYSYVYRRSIGRGGGGDVEYIENPVAKLRIGSCWRNVKNLKGVARQR